MYKIKLKQIFILIIVVIISLGINGCAKKPEGIVAEINGEEITEKEYKINLQIRQNICEGQFSESTLTEDILDELILENLIIQEAEKENIIVFDSEIEKEINDSMEELGGEKEFLKELEDKEIPFDYYEEFIRRQYLFRKYKESIIDKIEISEDDIKDYYFENKEDLIIVRASHILVQNIQDGEKILERLNKGEEFAELAIEESLDSLSAIKGGDLGYLSKGSLKNEEFEKVAFQLEVDKVSELVETDDGYHIIYIQDKKESLQDVRDEIIILLKDNEYKKHIQNLLDEAKVKIYLELDKE